MKLLIKGGRVVDPANNVDEVLDLLIEKGKIKNLAKRIEDKQAKVIKAGGKVVVPGLIDMHTHLREPGREDEETIETGTRAAASGGFTSIACMANTEPVVDNQSIVKFIIDKAEKEGLVNVFPVGAITKGLKGEELAEIGELKKAGVVAISDDGEPLMNSEVMRRALEYSKMFALPIISHPEDKNLSAGGVMNEGYISTILGFKGIPPQAEEVMVARDLILAEMIGGNLHFAHLSTRGSVELVREAKARGVKVTSEATPHHFTLTDEEVRSFDTDTKVNPPLRTEEDVKAVKQGLREGVIDTIATDHAPHSFEEKNVEYDYAPFGVVGLETALPLVITELVEKKALSLKKAIAKLTINPAKILGIDKGTLARGKDADVTIIDLKKEIIVAPDKFKSKSKNSPFKNRKLRGTVVMTIVKGKLLYTP
jgi:dihydroorotase